MKTKGSSFLYRGIEMNTTNTFIKVAEIQEILDISESKAYRIVRTLNKELESKGYMVIPGRVSRHYFNERFYGIEQQEGDEHNAGI